MSTDTRAIILLADEDDSSRVFLEDNLTADGYRVLSAEDRAKAIAMLMTQDLDLILVDVNGETLGLIDAVRSGEGIGGRADPGHADDRDEPRSGSAAADPAARAWGRRRRREAVQLSGAAGPDRRRAAPVAARRDADETCCGPGRSRSTSTRARCASAAGGSSCRPPSTS